MLTDNKIKALKSKDKTYKTSLGHGLFIEVRPNGSKLWRYQYKFNNKPRLMAFGAYPVISLDDAKRLHLEARKLWQEGKDPQAEKQAAKKQKAYEQENTFENALNEWFNRYGQELREKTLKSKRVHVQHLKPIFDKPIAKIMPLDIEDCFNPLIKAEKFEMASRVCMMASQVFELAHELRLVEVNIAAPLVKHILRKKPPVQHMAAITEEARLIELMKAISVENNILIRNGLLLLAMTFVRPSELRLATWQEFDLKAREWVIPAHRTKMNKEHSVPLNSWSIKLLEELRAIGDVKPESLILPSIRTPSRPISENTFNQALRRMGFDKNEIVSHGFRSVASTFLRGRLEFNRDVIEAALAHKVDSGVAAIYNRNDYWEARKQLLYNWALYLHNLIIGFKGEQAWKHYSILP